MDQFQSDQVTIIPEEATFNDGKYELKEVTVKGKHTFARSGEGFEEITLYVNGDITIESNEAKTIYCRFYLKQKDYDKMPDTLELEFTDIKDNSGSNPPESIVIENINKTEIKLDQELNN